MRLKSIKLAGFKSFVDPTTVQFGSLLPRVDVPGAREPEDIRDDWLEGQDKQLYRRWTGCTVFFLRGSAETEASDCQPLPEQRDLSSSDGALGSLDSLVTPMLDVLLGTSRRDKIEHPPPNKQSPVVDHAIAKAEYDMERQEQQLWISSWQP